jgi:hypothetical protein
LATNPRPVLITNPDHDDEFRTAAHAALEAGASDPAALQADLRDAYPKAVVHPRELSTEPTVVWYVYRDGHWIR